MKKLNVWWEKQQLRFTKKQHIQITVFGLILSITWFILLNDIASKTVFKRFPFHLIIILIGSFSGNALLSKKYKENNK
ncbi:MAG: hypothetical protein VW080_02610 [Flavobacteriaceae bacterium]